MVTACPGCGRTTSTVFQELAKRIQTFIRASMPQWEKKYPGYIVNKCLAPFDKQACLFVNEVNRRPHLENKLQFDFLINSLRRMNRFTPWLKSKKVNDIEYVKEYYGYSNEKAKSALTILSNEQLKYIKKKLN